jgi:O-antigen biosynthesis protein
MRWKREGMSHFKPYVIWVPSVPFSFASAGILVLHRLCHELNDLGFQSYVFPMRGHPTWNTPVGSPSDAIAIYPEIVANNPLGCSRVVRWILYPTKNPYPATDLLIPYMRAYNSWNGPEDLTLYLPSLDIDVFCDPGLPRRGRLRYIGSKGGRAPRVEFIDRLPELSRGHSVNQVDYALRLQTCELLYTYDNMSAINECARLCGCPVVIIPDGTFERKHYEQHELGMGGLGFGLEDESRSIASLDSKSFRDLYVELKCTFRKRLLRFVEYTQERFA